MTDFKSVTELSGEEATQEQIERLAQRYFWAGDYCIDKSVLEVACGTGQGLGYLASCASSIHAGDITSTLVAKAKSHYGERIDISVIDAQELPFADGIFDVVILFEAIYYLPSAELFVAECRRVLRPGGVVLIATANKDLYDFNPSPLSHKYYGVVELGELFGAQGFNCVFFGSTPVTAVSPRQRILRPIKALAVKFNLMPKTMVGKRLLKRCVFGGLVPMPAEISRGTVPYIPPTPLASFRPDHEFKAIFLAATLPA